MKILYIIDSGLNNGGAPKSTMILATEMANAGHEVFVCMPYTEDTVSIPNMKLVKIVDFKNVFPFELFNPLGSLKLARKVYNVIKDVNPDIIHAHMPRGARAVGLCRIFGTINCPIIYTERELVKEQGYIYKLMYKMLVKSCYNQIICLSNNAKTFWSNKRGMGITVIPNCGGDIYDKYNVDDRNKAFEKLQFEESSTKMNILFVGRLIKSKRWILAKEIVEKLNSISPEKYCFLFAVAYMDNPTYAEDLDIINKLEANYNNVKVYRNVDKFMMRNLYDVSNIHVITSEIESFGRTAIEAMARDTLVLSTDAGSIAETIGEKSLILPPEPEAFATVINKYAEDRDKLSSMANKLFDRYFSQYTTQSNYLRHIEMYNKLIEKS